MGNVYVSLGLSTVFFLLESESDRDRRTDRQTDGTQCIMWPAIEGGLRDNAIQYNETYKAP